jgi:hypothetical protein
MASEHDNGDECTVEVDESLIDAMLALSPEDRLRHNDRTLRTIELLRQAIGDEANEVPG